MNNALETANLMLRVMQTGIQLGILYVIWWAANHGIYPIIR